VSGASHPDIVSMIEPLLAGQTSLIPFAEFF
jgi:hypothetical protein